MSPVAFNRGFTILIAIQFVFANPFGVAAHEGPEHEIEELTEQIDKFGETASLLTERAIEYRVLGKWAEAARDLERATKLDPNSIHAYRELGRVQFLSGKTNEAIATVTRALTIKTEEPIDLGGLRILRAEFLRARGDYKKALDDCNVALQVHKQNPEWYLLRSDLQARLKLNKKRITGIEEGLKETGAGILEIELVEAWLDDKQFRAALTKIEAELKASRVQSSWLILRARARIGLGQSAGAQEDLKTALAEIGGRLNLTTPDVPLL
ncbi:MAG: tetratricopeptide repeat protein, partial [Opitutaceae bacterium]|nr:tetratricopeptide repeat protein [Verrucomicrobiales bacterium]